MNLCMFTIVRGHSKSRHRFRRRQTGSQSNRRPWHTDTGWERSHQGRPQQQHDQGCDQYHDQQCHVRFCVPWVCNTFGNVFHYICSLLFLPENHLSWKRFPVKLIKSCGPVVAVAEQGGEGEYLRDQGVNLPSPVLSMASRWGSIMLLSQSVAGADTHV